MGFTYITRNFDSYWVEEMDVQGLTIYAPGVLINSRYSGKQKFSTYIHEWLHMEFPKWKEAKVCSTEDYLVDMLWKQKCCLIFQDEIEAAIEALCKHWPRKYSGGLSHALITYLDHAGYKA